MPTKSSVTHQSIGKDLTPRLLEVLRQCENAWVTIGVHDDAGVYPGENAPSVCQVALWQEYGTPGAQNPIPSRSFLRTPIAANVMLINQWRDEALEKMLTKNWPVERALAMIGFRIRELVRNAIKRGIAPPLAASTIRAKQAKGSLPKKLGKKRRESARGTKTLIDTGLLLDSIKYQVWIDGKAQSVPTDQRR